MGRTGFSRVIGMELRNLSTGQYLGLCSAILTDITFLCDYFSTGYISKIQVLGAGEFNAYAYNGDP